MFSASHRLELRQARTARSAYQCANQPHGRAPTSIPDQPHATIPVKLCHGLQDCHTVIAAYRPIQPRCLTQTVEIGALCQLDLRQLQRVRSSSTALRALVPDTRAATVLLTLTRATQIPMMTPATTAAGPEVAHGTSNGRGEHVFLARRRLYDVLSIFSLRRENTQTTPKAVSTAAVGYVG